LPSCLFVSDLHGREERYERLFALIAAERPAGVFLGGDLLPSGSLIARRRGTHVDFVADVLAPGFARVRAELGTSYPRVFAILGNDDPRSEEAAMHAGEADGLWIYAHGRAIAFGTHTVYGYSYVPPTPFRLKDWERYDVSRYVDPGCVSPEEGSRSVPVEEHEIRHATIQEDLELLARDTNLARAIFLFHTPPYRTQLDRAALDGKMIDHVPLDVHVGSIALRRFIETRQPLLTLHGHVHEAARLTGVWRENLGRSVMIQGAHDGPELAVVRFDPEDPDAATRELL
jgi:Icc-related predicted phosphoesterase